MEKYVFVKKINGTDETGIVDISKTPPELICLCSEHQSNRLLQALNSSKMGNIEKASNEYAESFPHPTTEREQRYIKKAFKDSLMLCNDKPSEEKINELSLLIANKIWETNIGEVIIPLTACRQIVEIIIKNKSLG